MSNCHNDCNNPPKGRGRGKIVQMKVHKTVPRPRDNSVPDTSQLADAVTTSLSSQMTIPQIPVVVRQLSQSRDPSIL